MKPVVKVKAPAHFAAFCVALNEPFYFLNGAFYLVQWSDSDNARQFCADNGVRPCDLAGMSFETVTMNIDATPRETDIYKELDDYAASVGLDGSRPEGLSRLEADALEAYRRELNKYGCLDMSREAWIANYIDEHK